MNNINSPQQQPAAGTSTDTARRRRASTTNRFTNTTTTRRRIRRKRRRSEREDLSQSPSSSPARVATSDTRPTHTRSDRQWKRIRFRHDTTNRPTTRLQTERGAARRPRTNIKRMVRVRRRRTSDAGGRSQSLSAAVPGGTETEWSVPMVSRRTRNQPMHREREVQDGNIATGAHDDSQARLSHLNRSTQCLLSRADVEQRSKTPRIHSTGTTLALQSTAIWNKRRTDHIHALDETGHARATSTRHQCQHLPRRHDSDSTNIRSELDEHGGSSSFATAPRVPHQFRKEQVAAIEHAAASRIRVEHSKQHDTTALREETSAGARRTQSRASGAQRQPDDSTARGTAGQDDSQHRRDSTNENATTRTATRHQLLPAPSTWRVERPRDHIAHNTARATMATITRAEPSEPSTTDRVTARRDDHHRRRTRRVRRSITAQRRARQRDLRSLVTRRTQADEQHERDIGNRQRDIQFPTHRQTSNSPPHPHRQHDSSELPAPRRWTPMRLGARDGTCDTSITPMAHTPDDQPHTGRRERIGRRSVTTRHRPPQLGTSPDRLRRNRATIRRHRHGLVRRQHQRETQALRIKTARSAQFTRRRFSRRLARSPTQLLVPTDANDREDLAQDRRRRGTRRDSGAAVASTAVVANADVTDARATSPPQHNSRQADRAESGRAPNAGCERSANASSVGLSEAARQLLDDNATSWDHTVERQGQRFIKHLTTHNLPATTDTLINYLVTLFNTPKPNGLMIAPASVKQTMIAIDAHRARHALPPLKSHRTTQMLRAMRQRRPTGAAFIGADPINIRTVLQALPTRPTTLTAPNARRVPLPRITFEQARLRALMLLRIVTMLRPGEPASIKRSTITTARHPADPNRIILRFNYRSKSATRFGYATDGNYLEYLPNDAPQRHLCPARAVEDLLLFVRRLHLSNTNDALFTDRLGCQLSGERCSSIVRDFLHGIGVSTPRCSHALRGATNTLLSALNVPAPVIATRAGWHGHTGDATQSRHYTQFRIVGPDFASLIINSATKDSLQNC